MAVRVLCCCTYRTNTWINPWEPSHYDANKFVKLIKGHSYRDWAWVPVEGRSVRIDTDSTPEYGAELFGRIVADRFANDLPSGAFVFVPIPHKDCTVAAGVPANARALADAAVAALKRDDVGVSDVLRWTVRHQRAHEGGRRDAVLFYRTLTVVGDIPADRSIVLVDDVVTSGSAIRSAAARLAKKFPNNPVVLALAAGRTDNDVFTGDAFGTREETLEDLNA